MITIRPMPEGYPRDCWIVTGAIWSSEVRFFRKLPDAKRYAKDLEKTILPLDISIIIEERQSDRLQRLPILESYQKGSV